MEHQKKITRWLTFNKINIFTAWSQTFLNEIGLILSYFVSCYEKFNDY